MATMYNIRIKEIDKNSLTTEVTYIHPDAGKEIGSKEQNDIFIYCTGNIRQAL